MEYTHVITNAVTGEVSVVPFTQEEIDAYLASQVQVEVLSPLDKLKAFLESNPDVASILK